MPSDRQPSGRGVPGLRVRSSVRAAVERVGGMLGRADCLLCLAPIRGKVEAGAQVCADCDAELPRPAPHACRQCAASLDAPGVCGTCLADPPAFDAAVAACRYAFPVSPVISQFKYGARLALAGWLADVLARAVRQRGELGVDWMLPLPLSRERLAERGFNQSALIAAGVSRRVGLPLHRNELLRVRHTAPQASLDHDERKRNVRGAFDIAADAAIADQRIALVDDVMTTGATLDAAAQALKKAGAARVEVWVVARADRRDRILTQQESEAGEQAGV